MGRRGNWDHISKVTYQVKTLNGLAHKHIDQLHCQPDFKTTEQSNNENEIINPEILVDKDYQLPQPVCITTQIT